MTTSAVVSAYHLTVTRLWIDLAHGRHQQVVDEIDRVLDPNDPLTPIRIQAVQQVLALANGVNVVASLLDLQRISLTYVTNKKGGDQIIETLQPGRT